MQFTYTEFFFKYGVGFGEGKGPLPRKNKFNKLKLREQTFYLHLMKNCFLVHKQRDLM